jgi:two-component system sensor histidine kinase TctE
MRLLAWLVVPLLIFVAIDSWTLYRTAIQFAHTAYDRTLLASARAIGERLVMRQGALVVDVPFSALDFFDSTYRGRIYYRVGSFDGQAYFGYADFPPLRDAPLTTRYGSLAHFYDDEYRGEPVRVAALRQPVPDDEGHAMVLIQVAETQETRRTVARELLGSILLRQASIVIAVALGMWVAVTFALRPLERLREQLAQREPGDAAPFRDPQHTRELAPLVATLNATFARLTALIESRRRFLADASHQLRTPLTALKTQAELLLRRQREKPAAEADPALESIARTADHAGRLASQLLSIARAEYVAQLLRPERVDLAAAARDVCLDLGARAIERDIALQFDADAAGTHVAGDAGLLTEIASNLVDNALKYTPAGGAIAVAVRAGEGRGVVLEIEDSGPGVAEAEMAQLGRRFFTVRNAGAPHGTGLGLAIVKEIAAAHGAEITFGRARAGGLRVQVRFPPAG